MRKFLVIAVALAGFMAMTHGAFARPIEAARPLPARPQLSPLEYRYLSVYHQVVVRNGNRAPGRNIVRRGLRNGHPPDTARLARSVHVLERMLAPPPVSVPTVRNSQTTVAVARASTSGAMPSCTWAPESGGSYTAVNPSSGAGGKYQIIPSTWKAYGGVEANAADAPPAEQDAVARAVMAGQGTSAWVNC